MPEFDRTKISTYSIKDRSNKESFNNFELKNPDDPITHPDFSLLIERIKAAMKNGKPVIACIGGHVIKTGMSFYLIDLIKKGFISHIATNGAGSIHDFEIAFQGATSEDVGEALKDGSFGMAHETAFLINNAVRDFSTVGYGGAVGNMISKKDLPNKESSLQYVCFKEGIPFTVHKSIGTDIIDQHPSADYAKMGEASGVDFLKFVDSVSKLDGGVLLNFGCAVTAPEVFLKAISMTRNVLKTPYDITTANFDQLPHYRPKVNIVERPTAHHENARGFNFSGKDEQGKSYLHQRTIPSLWMALAKHPVDSI